MKIYFSLLCFVVFSTMSIVAQNSQIIIYQPRWEVGEKKDLIYIDEVLIKKGDTEVLNQVDSTFAKLEVVEKSDSMIMLNYIHVNKDVERFIVFYPEFSERASKYKDSELTVSFSLNEKRIDIVNKEFIKKEKEEFVGLIDSIYTSEGDSIDVFSGLLLTTIMENYSAKNGNWMMPILERLNFLTIPYLNEFILDDTIRVAHKVANPFSPRLDSIKAEELWTMTNTEFENREVKKMARTFSVDNEAFLNAVREGMKKLIKNEEELKKQLSQFEETEFHQGMVTTALFDTESTWPLWVEEISEQSIKSEMLTSYKLIKRKVLFK